MTLLINALDAACNQMTPCVSKPGFLALHFSLILVWNVFINKIYFQFLIMCPMCSSFVFLIVRTISSTSNHSSNDLQYLTFFPSMIFVSPIFVDFSYNSKVRKQPVYLSVFSLLGVPLSYREEQHSMLRRSVRLYPTT